MRLALLVALLAGCSDVVTPCAEGTLFVALALEGGTQAADTLVIGVSVDEGAVVETTIAHSPGVASGGIQIEFPRGYPRGSAVRVHVAASQSAVLLGASAVILTLTGGCERAQFTVSPSAPGDLGRADLSSPGDLPAPDLPGAEMAADDLATADLGSTDLAGVDLTCVPITEDCFNGGDDDCDGLADCADPDCTTGGSPVAECVSPPGSSTPGLLVQGAAPCPLAYPTKTPIGAVFSAGSCAIGSCGSSGSITGVCSVTFQDAGSDNTCGCAGSCPKQTYTSTQACAPYNIPGSNYHNISAQTWSVGSSTCPSTGAPVETPGSFATNDAFCETTRLGVGCSGGQACVPKAATHCVMIPGNAATCPSNYVQNSTRYFKSISDNLSCACSFVATPGDCTSTAGLYDSSCNNFAGSPSPGCFTANWNGYYVGVSAAPGTCGPSFESAGSSQAADEQTVCCLP